MIHVDTSFAVDFLRERRRHANGPAHAWMRQHGHETLGACVHVRCELLLGARLSKRGDDAAAVQLFLDGVVAVPTTVELAERYAELMAHLLRRGERISEMDALIASQALADGASVLTRNVKEFSRVPGLRVETY